MAVHSVPVSRAQFEADRREWPLTVDHGRVASNGAAVWFEAPDGTLYALNGIAMALPEYADITPIHQLNQQHWEMLESCGVDPLNQQIPHMPLGDLIDIGLNA